MSLFTAEHTKTFKTPSRYKFQTAGYRTYPNRDRVGYADANRIRYRRLLFDLKKSDPFAVDVFASLLCLLYDEMLGGPDAIACVPTSSRSNANRDDANALVARKAIESGLGVIDGSSWLKRTRDVPKAHQDSSMRTIEKQLETISYAPERDHLKPFHILVIDDICTSGSTMMACAERLREQFPGAKITGFCFGYTGWVDSSPKVPQFPDRGGTLASLCPFLDAWKDDAWPRGLDGVRDYLREKDGWVHFRNCSLVRPSMGPGTPLDSKAEAESRGLQPCPYCKPFDKKKKPKFVYNDYSNKIHHAECHTGPGGYGYGPLWSLRHGIRLGGELCQNCMHKWPLAKELYEERQRLLAAGAVPVPAFGFADFFRSYQYSVESQ